MTTNYYAYKVTALPAVLQSNALYLVTDSDPDFVEIYFADNAGSAARRVMTRQDVNDLVTNGMSITSFTRAAYGSTTAAASERILMKSGGTLALPATPITDEQILVSAETSDVTIMPMGGATVGGGASSTVRAGETFILTYDGAGNWSRQHWGGQRENFMENSIAP